MTAMPTNAATVATVAAIGGPQNGREARNLAEKHRRDKLNASIQELSTMVPHVAESPRRMDKTAVLRFAAHGLRLQYVFGKSATRAWTARQQAAADQPEQEEQSHLTDTLMQLTDSFFLTLTCHGQIVLVSASVEQLLGHCQSDLYGQNILNVTHPDDQAQLRQQLIPHDMDALFRSDCGPTVQLSSEGEGETEEETTPRGGSESGDIFDYYRAPSPRTQAHFDDIDRRLRADRRCFIVRLARVGTRSEASRQYEIVKFDGCFRRSDFSASAGNFPIVSQLIKRSRSNGGAGTAGAAGALQHDAFVQAALHGISGNDIVLVAMVRIIRAPPPVVRTIEPNRLEYRTRHLIDGCIIDCDQRISLVTGYMKDEVRNLSPFSFMHQDDVRWVIVALRRMYDCNSDYGESCYRLLTRNGHFIYLQTKGYLEIDKSTNNVHSFLCINTLLEEEEGRRKVQEMKNKFSIIIKTKIPSNSLQDIPAAQNPQQLERIVLYLIENLQKRHGREGSDSGVGVSVDQVPHSVTPPLALVPPAPASVKSSISKSVSIVNVTRQMNSHSQKSPASLVSNDSSLSPASSLEPMEDVEEQVSSSFTSTAVPPPQRPSVLQMNILTPPSEASSASPSASPGTSVLQQQISVLKRLRTASEESNSPAKRTSLHGSPVSGSPSSSSTSPGIHSVLSTSLQSLDKSLVSIGHDATLLHKQHASLAAAVPESFDQKLNDIFEEFHRQKTILVNIKSEYGAHVQQQASPPPQTPLSLQQQKPPALQQLPEKEQSHSQASQTSPQWTTKSQQTSGRRHNF